MGWMSAICDAHKKKVGVELLYNSVKTGSQFEDQTRWWQDAVKKASTQQSVPLGSRLSSPGKRGRNTVMANRVGVNMLQFCSVSNSLSHTNLSNKVRGIFFWKTVSSLSVCCYDAAYLCKWACVFIVLSIQQNNLQVTCIWNIAPYKSWVSPTFPAQWARPSTIYGSSSKSRSVRPRSVHISLRPVYVYVYESEERFLLLKYILTLSLILCSYY